MLYERLTALGRMVKTRAGCLAWTGVVLAVILAAAAGILLRVHWNDAPRLVSFSLTPRDDVHIGDVLTVRVLVECPWRVRPLQAVDLDLPDGLQELPGGRLRLRSIGPGVWKWESTVRLQPVRTGRVGGAALHITFTGPGLGSGRPARVDVLLPAVEVVPRISGDETVLHIAPRLGPEAAPVRRRWWQWVLLAVFCAAVLGIVVWLLRRKEEERPAPERPPWETAGMAIEELESRLPMPAEAFFVEFTDILRAYFEARFHLPAGEQTTQEFLRNLQTGRLLDESTRAMLEQVLAAADMVKFARADASERQMRDALDLARRLLAATRPAQQEQETDATPGRGAPDTGT